MAMKDEATRSGLGENLACEKKQKPEFEPRRHVARKTKKIGQKQNDKDKKR
jgi:hypothetical protein